MAARKRIQATADQIIEALWPPPRSDLMAFRELRLSTGYGGVAERRIDLYVVAPLPSKAWVAYAYEVKISRGDYFADVRDQLKQRGTRLFADFFFYATPPGLLKPDEIPDWAGLVEVDPTTETWYGRKKIIVPAPRLDKSRPTWGLVASMVRNVRKAERRRLHKLGMKVMTEGYGTL